MSHLEMDAAALAQVSKLLDEALELPAAARADWVESLDVRFDGLKPRLRDLLSRAASVETGEFLETIPKVAVPDAGSAASARAGELIGAYRLLRELGSGGMGAVWLAERADGLIQRRVALKLPHLVTPRRAELAGRMAREREILAALDHRNIAKLFDAGLTSEGQPYLALEYVEGVPIDQYLRGASDDAALPLEQRLRLFLQVAHAVAYAHGKLVVHRDLKPANILVTANGGVRLLDFGIAKLLDDGEARATQLTRLSGGAFTPEYASPEQILGEPLTVASDVYSLGVVLYELLTGTRPYRLKRDSLGALEEAILQVAPARPSEIAPTGLRRSLRGDLDTIVLKALKKAAAERYATVNAFADDVTRHLEHRPVLAQPDSAAYRLHKFVVRNRFAVAGAATVFVALLAGAGVASWQAQRANAERVRAQTVRAVLTGMFENADPYSNGGAPLSAADLLLRAKQTFEANPSGDPGVRAEVANTLARSLFRLNEDAASETLAAKAFADMRNTLPADDRQRARMQVLIAEQLRYRGKTREARSHLDAAQPILAGARATHPEDVIYALLISADVAIDDSDYARALADARRARQLSIETLGREHEYTVRAMGAITETYFQSERYPEALANATETLALAKVVFRDGPHSPFLSDERSRYAKALGASGRYADAADQFELLVHEDTAIHGPDSVEVGMRLQSLAGWQVRAGRIAQAIESSNRAAAIRLPQVEPVSFESVAARYVQASVLLAGRRMLAANRVLVGLEPDARALFGDGHERALDVRALRALVQGWTGETEPAAASADEVIRVARARGTPVGFLPLHARAQIARLAGDADGCAQRESTILQEDKGQLRRVERVEALAELGTCAVLRHDAAVARASLAEALSLLDQMGNGATPLRAEVLLAQAQLALEQHDAPRALALTTTADEFWRGFEADSRGAGVAAYWRARAERAAGRTTAARQDFARAADLLRDSALRMDRELVRVY